MSTEPGMGTSDRIDVWDQTLRDGLSKQTVLPLVDKVLLFRQLATCGFRHLEVTRFPRRDTYTQFHDGVPLLHEIQSQRREIDIAVFAVGDAGIDEALTWAELYDQLHVPCFASDAYGQYVLGEKWDSALKRLNRAREESREAGVSLTVGFGTAFGCPFDRDHHANTTVSRFRDIVSLGVDCVMVGDTAGTATPSTVRAFLASIADLRLPRVRLHFHNTFGRALTNAYAAVECADVGIDASLLGIGGEAHPYFTHPELVDNGNLAVEELLLLLGDDEQYRLQAQVLPLCEWLAARLDRPFFGRAAFARFTECTVDEIQH